MTKLKYIVIGFVSLLFLFACEKQPFDYRNKYLGDYEITEHVRCIIADSLCNYSSETVTTIYNGKIIKGKSKNSSSDKEGGIIIVYGGKEISARKSSEQNTFIATPPNIPGESIFIDINLFVSFSKDNSEFKMNYGGHAQNPCGGLSSCSQILMNKTVNITGIKK